MRRRARLVVSIAATLGVVAAAVLAVHRVRGDLDRPLPIAAPVIYRIAPGSSLGRIAAQLHQLGVLPAPWVWTLYARWRGDAGAVRAGEYALHPGLTARGLLEQFVKGRILLRSFTIIDGWRVADLLAALRASPYLTTTLPPAPKDLMARFGEPGRSPEGEFLPQTYEFPRGTRDVALLAIAHRALVDTLAAAWKSRAPDLPLRDPQQLLILASIVEKESALPDERARIAGVYLHRLSIGMRLQADPTVIFGLGARYRGRLHAADLRADGPYNTYTRAGLPPTPIALPGAAAIDACAHPVKTDALYFVASGKGDGRHVFSATLAEQNAAVKRYLRRLRRHEAAAPKERR